MTHETILLSTVVVAVFAAVLLQVVAKRLRIPAIALLLPAGIALGPELLGWVQPAVLKDDFKVVIGLAVAVILFEGGLTLDVAGFRMAPKVIRRILSAGVLVTWTATAAAIVLLFGYDWSFALLAASLTVVTGPTVIGPILRRVRIRDRLHQILHWEGVLIDPIGVFMAVGCYEWLQAATTLEPFVGFAARVGLGLAIGVAGGRALVWVLQRGWIDSGHDNLFVFATALLIFATCDLLLPESGLLGVTVAGLVVGLSRAPRLKEIKRFKLDLTKLAIGVLFILLAARLDIASFGRLGLAGFAVVALVMFVVRPLNVLVSTWGSPLDWRERTFLALMAPRGIVAASMGSLFALLLAEHASRMGDAWFLEVFTYAVIGGTVMVQGLGAPVWARLLGVAKPSRRTWIVVGARDFPQAIAQALGQAGIPAILLDSNPDHVAQARHRGLDAIQGDVLDPSLFDDPRLNDVGTMLCATGSALVDEVAAHRWHELMEVGRTFRLASGTAGERAAKPSFPPNTAGREVWPELGVLADVEADIRAGDLAVRLIEKQPDTRRGGDRPLLVVAGGQARPADPGAVELPAGQMFVVLGPLHPPPIDAEVNDQPAL